MKSRGTATVVACILVAFLCRGQEDDYQIINGIDEFVAWHNEVFTSEAAVTSKIRLASDLVFDETAQQILPLGKTHNTPFSGVLDGAGFSIKELNVTAAENCSIFYKIAGGTVKNLVVDETCVFHSTNNDAAAIAILAEGSFVFDHVTNKANVTAKRMAAGFVLQATPGAELTATITNCLNQGRISSGNSSNGFIYVFNTGSLVVMDTSNTGEIYVNNLKDWDYDWTIYQTIGAGFVSRIEKETVNVTFDSVYNSGKVLGYVGYLDCTLSGLVANMTSKVATFKNSENRGLINTNQRDTFLITTITVAGIVAYAIDGDLLYITNTSNSGPISIYERNRIARGGGIVMHTGFKETVVENSNNTGVVDLTGKSTLSSTPELGGIVAHLGEYGRLTITNCFNTAFVWYNGTVGWFGGAGGILGTAANHSFVTIRNCSNEYELAPSGYDHEQVDNHYYGGILGWAIRNSTIVLDHVTNKGLYATNGKVGRMYLGGILGYAENETKVYITNAINMAKLVSYSWLFEEYKYTSVGGIVDHMGANGFLFLENVTNTANVSAYNTNNDCYCGGILGTTASPTIIRNALSTGHVNCTKEAGGIIGKIDTTDFPVVIENAKITGTITSETISNVARYVTNMTNLVSMATMHPNEPDNYTGFTRQLWGSHTGTAKNVFFISGLCDECDEESATYIQQNEADSLFYTTETNERVDELLNKEVPLHSDWLAWTENLSFGGHFVTFSLPNDTEVRVAADVGQLVSEATAQLIVDGVDLEAAHLVRCDSDQGENDVVERDTEVWSNICLLICHKVTFVGETTGVWFVEHGHAMSTNKHIAAMYAEAEDNKTWSNDANETQLIDNTTVVDGDLVVRVSNITIPSSSSSSSSSSVFSSSSSQLSSSSSVASSSSSSSSNPVSSASSSSSQAPSSSTSSATSSSSIASSGAKSSLSGSSSSAPASSPVSSTPSPSSSSSSPSESERSSHSTAVSSSSAQHSSPAVSSSPAASSPASAPLPSVQSKSTVTSGTPKQLQQAVGVVLLLVALFQMF